MIYHWHVIYSSKSQLLFAKKMHIELQVERVFWVTKIYVSFKKVPLKDGTFMLYRLLPKLSDKSLIGSETFEVIGLYLYKKAYIGCTAKCKFTHILIYRLTLIFN